MADGGGDSSDAMIITEDKIDRLLAIISDVAARWRLFAGQLSLSQASISQIERDTPHGDGYSMECLRSVLYHWVKEGGRGTTYQAVADALQSPVLNDNVLARNVEVFREGVRDEPPSYGQDVPFSEKMSATELSQWLHSQGLDGDDSERIIVNKINGLVFSKMRPEHIGRLGLSMAAEILIEDILKTKISLSFDSASTQVDLPNDPIWNSKPSFAFLQLIKWRNKKGQKEELRIFRELAPYWEDAASLLGLSHAEMGIIKRNNVGDQLSSIRDTISKWLMNGNRLPNSRQYPVNWKGLYHLLDDIQQGTLVSPLLREALTSSRSNVRRNF